MKKLMILIIGLMSTLNAVAADCSYIVGEYDNEMTDYVLRGAYFDASKMNKIQACDSCANAFRTLPLEKRTGTTRWLSGAARNFVNVDNIKNFKVSVIVTTNRGTAIHCSHFADRYEFNASERN